MYKEPEKVWILSFCAECGAGLRRLTSPMPGSRCENCGYDVTLRLSRIEGYFNEGEAKRLVQIWFGEKV